MSLFTSRRERKLWMVSGVVIAAIYSTLGVAGLLSDFLCEKGLLESSFFLGFILIFIAIVGNGLKKKTGKYEIWIQLGVFVVLVMIILRMGVSPEERTHLFEYGFLALMIHEALLERKKNGRNVQRMAIMAIGITVLLGSLDEGIQYLLPSRIFDYRDIGFNALAEL